MEKKPFVTKEQLEEIAKTYPTPIKRGRIGTRDLFQLFLRYKRFLLPVRSLRR